MAEGREVPAKLYKYPRFDVTTLKMITDHGLYSANRAASAHRRLEGIRI